MVKKTKRTRKLRQKGGAIPFLPPEVAPRCPPGCKSKEMKTLAEAFFNNNNIYYITGHGGLLPNKTYEVPPNTYILHAGVSGKSIFSNSITCQGQNEFKELVQELYTVDLWKLLTNQAGHDTGMYSREVYEPNKELLAIYEPGDIVSDMIFEFSNLGSTEKDITGCGIYKVPVNDNLNEQQENVLREKSAMLARIKFNGERNKKSADEIRKQQESEIYPFIKEKDTVFRNRSDNLLKTWFTRKLSAGEEQYIDNESKIVNDTGRFPGKPGGIRLFIVWACRSVTGISSKENALAAAKKARRRSINLHKYNVGVREKYERDMAERIERLRRGIEEERAKSVEAARPPEPEAAALPPPQLENAIANTDRVILDEDYTVIKNLRQYLPEANKTILNAFNQTYKNQRKAKYDEIFRRLKKTLEDERDAKITAIENTDRVILDENYNVIKNLRNFLPEANKTTLNTFNQTQKNQRKAKYDEIFRRLKKKLQNERDAGRNK